MHDGAGAAPHLRHVVRVRASPLRLGVCAALPAFPPDLFNRHAPRVARTVLWRLHAAPRSSTQATHAPLPVIGVTRQQQRQLACPSTQATHAPPPVTGATQQQLRQQLARPSTQATHAPLPVTGATQQQQPPPRAARCASHVAALSSRPHRVPCMVHQCIAQHAGGVVGAVERCPCTVRHGSSIW